MTAEQAQAVLDAAKGHLEALVTLALVLGLRTGELLGVRWADIDFDASEITVSRTISWISGKGFVIHEPKTRLSARTIPMVLGVEAALREHRKTQRENRMARGAKWEPDGWVFATYKGTLLMPGNVLRQFQKLTIAVLASERCDFTRRGTPLPRSSSRRACLSKWSQQSSAIRASG